MLVPCTWYSFRHYSSMKSFTLYNSPMSTYYFYYFTDKKTEVTWPPNSIIIEPGLKLRQCSSRARTPFYFLIDLRKCEEGREKHGFVFPLIYAFISWFSYVPWPGIKPATTEYQDDAQTNWTTQAGPRASTLSHYTYCLSTVHWQEMQPSPVTLGAKTCFNALIFLKISSTWNSIPSQIINEVWGRLKKFSDISDWEHLFPIYPFLGSYLRILSLKIREKTKEKVVREVLGWQMCNTVWRKIAKCSGWETEILWNYLALLRT